MQFLVYSNLYMTKKIKPEVLKSFFAASTPLLFTFLAVFITRESIQTFYLMALGLIVLELYLLNSIKKEGFKKIYPYILIICASIGLAAAGILTIEKIELLKDPNRVTSCSLSPIVACSPVINSPQGSVFTIPNPAFGLLGFGCVLAAGMSILAGGKFKKWWWQALLAGSVVGLGAVAWLIYQSLFEIKSICLYCTAVWLIVIPTFVLTLKSALEENAVKLPEKAKDLVKKYPLEIIVTMYGIVIALILQRFWSYWISLI